MDIRSMGMDIRLQQRHIREDGICTLCNNGQESITHAIFYCPNVNQVWCYSPFADLLSEAPGGEFIDIYSWMRGKLPKHELLGFAALAWATWSFRNSVVFGEPWQNRDVGVLGFLRLVKDFSSYSRVVSVGPKKSGVESKSIWRPPAAGIVRINSDAAVLSSSEASLGAVLRDENGDILAAKVQRVMGQNSVLVLEALAARMGMEVARNYGCSKVELESDALSVVNLICAPKEGKAPVNLIVEDIKLISRELDSFSCFHVKRSGNCVAHLMARQCPPNGNVHLFVDNIPQGVASLAEYDVG